PNPCQNNGVCTDLINDYSCACKPGWTGKQCDTDIDECQSNPCTHGECKNGVNDYTCTCKPGYEGKNCDKDRDECHSNPCKNQGTCIDQVNSYR
ncbi:Fibropellin-1, partial [Exaiptasia diaphana]